MSIVQIEGLQKHYGRARVLTDVSLTVEAGTIYGLLGPNGAGKSVLLRVLATLERPSAGLIRIDGRDPLQETRAVRSVVGYVPERLGVYSGLTVWEHLEFAARCYSVPRREWGSTIDTLLSLVDLHAERATLATGLSRGQRRRLALARGLVHNPSVLLLDDPLADLDVQGRPEVLEVFRELAAMGKTLLVTSHLVPDLISACDAAGVLAHGRMLHAGRDLLALVSGEADARLRIEVAAGATDSARRVLLSLPEVRELASASDSLSFRFAGDQEARAHLLQTLIAQEVPVASFATEAASPDLALVQLWQEGSA